MSSLVCYVSLFFISLKGENDSKPPLSLSVVVLITAVCMFVFQMVSELPETVVGTVPLQQEDPRKKNAGQKKKNRERGKVRDKLRNGHQ